MERDSILLYRSFYEAIKGLPKDIQLEIYSAIMEYGLNGVTPDNLKPVAAGMFALMKPVIDNNNIRFENGKKGAAYGKRGGRPPKKKTTTGSTEYSLSFEQEVNQMKADTEWYESIREDYNLSPQELDDRLKHFLKHCQDKRKNKPHDSFDDAKSHLRYWMDKAFKKQQSQPAPTTSNNPTPDFPIFDNDFGAADYDEQNM